LQFHKTDSITKKHKFGKLVDDEWVKLQNASWICDFYAIGDKPTSPPMKKLKVKIELDRNEFEIEVPYDARPQEVDKVILDMATQFMRVTQEII